MFVCPKCRAIYVREIEHCGRDGTRLEQRDEDPLPGTRLGPYQILELVGEGAIGRVYRARRVNLNAEFAIKILYGDHSADREAVARMKALKGFGEASFRVELKGHSLRMMVHDEAVVEVTLTDGGLYEELFDLVKRTISNAKN